MSKGFKIGAVICFLIALVLVGLSTDYAAEILKDYSKSRIFITLFVIGVPSIWIILFKIEKKNLEKKDIE